MFERFTTQARGVVIGAHHEAHDLRHRYIGTEHLLLALLRPDSGQPSAVLTAAGLDAPSTRVRIVELVAGTRLRRLSDQVPETDRASQTHQAPGTERAPGTEQASGTEHGGQHWDDEDLAGTALGAQDAAALEAIGIDLAAIRAKIEESFGPGALDPLPSMRPQGLFRRRRGVGGRTPFTGRAKKVLELSLREAIALRHGRIGSEHILLGLLREGHGLAAQVMADRGVDVEELRAVTIRSLQQAA